MTIEPGSCGSRSTPHGEEKAAACLENSNTGCFGHGVRRITPLLPDGETGTAAFVNSGFIRRGGIAHFELPELRFI